MHVELAFALEWETFWKLVVGGKYGEDDGYWHSVELREDVWIGL